MRSLVVEKYVAWLCLNSDLLGEWEIDYRIDLDPSSFIISSQYEKPLHTRIQLDTPNDTDFFAYLPNLPNIHAQNSIDMVGI